MTLSILNGEIFSAEKQNQLCSMMNALKSVWDNASDEILPFICRKKVENVIVSVVIPVYNVEKYLTKALQSIVNQTLEDIEIICIDDGSTDRSLEILNFFAAHDERITAITQPNSNAGVARNRGLDLARGKYLYFMDSDDWVVPHMLEKAVATAESANSDLVVWSHSYFDSKTGKILRTVRYNDGEYDARKEKYVFNKISHCVWHKLFLRQTITDNKLRYQEIVRTNDAAFAICMTAVAKKIVTIAEPMYFYRKSGTGLQASLNQSPLCCFLAHVHAKNELIRLKLLHYFQDSLRNSIYTTIAYQLCRFPLTFEQLIEVRTLLNKNFDYSSTSENDISNKWVYLFAQSMFFNNENFYPTKTFTCLEQKYLEYNSLKKKFSATNNKLKSEIKKLKQSRSYRLGRALTWLPRKIRGGIRCLKQHGVAYTCKRLKQKISKKLT